MRRKKRLCENQSGNKMHHSSETRNVLITDKALEAMDVKKVTLVVLLDLSKAFDSIDHTMLLAKLQALGVSHASLHWFKSYLSERLQCVRINPEKTKLLVLGIRQMLQRLPADFHVTLLGKKVTTSPSARDLGLQVDCTLSYDEHVTQTVSSCIGSLCQINRVKHLFDARTLQRVINALVFSKLYYCSPVWSNTSKKNILNLQKVQNFAGRIITGTRQFDHITPVLRELRWLPVSSYLKYTFGVLAFKCVKGLAPSYLCDRLKTRATLHDGNTRYKDSLNIPAYKSAPGQRTFLYRATNLWNSLPRALINSASLQIFKRELKEFLFS